MKIFSKAKLNNTLMKIILLFLFVICLFFAINNIVFAFSDVTENPGDWKPQVENMSADFESKVENLLGIITTFGVVISVLTLMIIGIKYMSGSVEEKAEYKKSLLPWVVGAIIVFSGTTLPTIIYNYMEDINLEDAHSPSPNPSPSADRSPNPTPNANQIPQQVTVKTTKITLSNPELRLNETTMKTYKLIATVEPSNSSELIEWKSSNNNIATVDSNGLVTAKSVGTATITATSGDKTASCNVRVQEVTVRTSKITLSKNSLALGTQTMMSYELNATIEPSNSTESISWISSDNNVVTVKDGKVTAVGSGNATITCKSGTQSDTCTVQVDGERLYLAQYYNPSTQTVSSTKSSNNDLGFWIYMPDISLVKDLDKIPMIVFLHGTGEWGSNLNNLNNIQPFYLKDRDYPAIIIYPQCPANVAWSSIHSKIKGLIDYSISNYNVDPDKIALTGFSWGGTGVWEIGVQYPNLFSCLVPVCGYMNANSYNDSSKYPDCPIWINASTGDRTNATAVSLNQKLKDAGKDVQFSSYTNIHSEMQAIAYTKNLIDWMIAQEK